MQADNDIAAILVRARAAIEHSNALTYHLRTTQLQPERHDGIDAVPGSRLQHSRMQAGLQPALQTNALIPGRVEDVRDDETTVQAYQEGAVVAASGELQTTPYSSTLQTASYAASHLALLTQQHTSTLKQLYGLRMQQLVLRKQQVTALHGLIIAQIGVLGDAPVVTTAVRNLKVCHAPRSMSTAGMIYVWHAVVMTQMTMATHFI